MRKNGLAGLDDVDEEKSLTRVFRLTVDTTCSPKISLFKAFFNFSKSFTQTSMNARLNAMCTVDETRVVVGVFVGWVGLILLE